MDFHDSVAEFHTVAVSTEDADSVFVLTDSGWRCYRFAHAAGSAAVAAGR